MAVYTGVPVFTWEMWAHWTSNIHNGSNVAFHIETDPFHVVTDVFSYRYRCFSCRCASVPIFHTSKGLFFMLVSCRSHIGTDVKIGTFTCRSSGISCRFTSVPTYPTYRFSCRSLNFSCRYRITSVSVYMSVKARNLCEPPISVYMSVAPPPTCKPPCPLPVESDPLWSCPLPSPPVECTLCLSCGLPCG